jgi:stage V sporulation protein G
MQVTDVRLRKINSEGKTRALGSVTFDGEFVVHEIRVIEGANGYFVSMPSKKSGDGEYRDLAHPITSNFREAVQSSVLKAFGELAS